MGRRFDGRPLLLVTDSPPVRGRRTLEQLRRPRDRALTRLQYIPWSIPVSVEHLDAINHWLDLAQTPAGHTELRKLRGKDLDRARRRITTEPSTREARAAKLRRLGRHSDLFGDGYLKEVREGWDE